MKITRLFGVRGAAQHVRFLQPVDFNCLANYLNSHPRMGALSRL